MIEVADLALTAGGLILTIVGGQYVVMRNMKLDGDRTRKEGEDRAVRTHERLDNLRQHIDDKCVSKEVYHSDLRRLDDAIRERDQLHADLSSRLGCPSRGEA